jgi:hypothetical protein
VLNDKDGATPYLDYQVRFRGNVDVADTAFTSHGDRLVKACAGDAVGFAVSIQLMNTVRDGALSFTETLLSNCVMALKAIAVGAVVIAILLA